MPGLLTSSILSPSDEALELDVTGKSEVGTVEAGQPGEDVFDA